jgi:trimeric autotransporter adhesin
VSSYFKFLRRVRIHGRECGAVARALRHKIEANPLSAADRKVLSTTIERKAMSNSTFFKRIAVTAIAALGLGVLSVIPAKAEAVGAAISIDAATDAVTVGESATASVTHSFYADTAADSVNIRVVLTSGTAGNAGSIRLGVSDSSTSVEGAKPVYSTIAVAGGLGAANNIAISSGSTGSPVTLSTKNRGTADANLGTNAQPDSFNVSTGTGGRSVRTTISLTNYAPQKAGTYVWTVFTSATNATGGLSSSVSTTWTVTVTNRSTTANSTSTSWLRQGTAAESTYQGDSQALASATASSTTPRFTIYTDLNNTLGVDEADNAADSVTVVATGQAYVCTSSTASCQDRSQTIAMGSSSTATYIYSTGTAGTATVVITALNSGLTWTKTLTFYGSVATASIGTSKYKIARTGGFSTAGMFTVLLKDAAGNAVPGQTVTITSSDLTQIASGSCADAVGLATDGVYACELTSSALSTSGGKATVTATYENPVTEVEYSTTYDVTLGGGVSTVVLTTDKATYEPGEKMVVTATAKDASGNPVYDGLSGPTLTANKSLGGTLTMNVYVGGVSTSQTRSSTTGLVTTADTIYAPAASGKFSISGSAGDAAATQVSVTATVGDDAATTAANAASDAAAEAIDAANAATDAANLAAEAADAATVAAEEARDAADAATAAVEALATEVATLMAALKAQITTLANTVAKIAKKVKA